MYSYTQCYLATQRTQPKTCSDYPKSVLWTFEDYKNEHALKNGSYRSQPNMRLAIRYEDGQKISNADYEVMYFKATCIVRKHLYLVASTISRSGIKIPEPKTVYKAKHVEEWYAVV